jgi:hypothetical protein
MAAERVLVVISDWELRGACQAALLAAGYRVVTSSDEDGARYVLGSFMPPDAVLFCSKEPLLRALQGLVGEAPQPVIAAVPPVEGNDGDPGADAVAAVRDALASRAPRVPLPP